MRDRRHRRPCCLSWSSRLFRVLLCARLPGSLGSPDPVCPRRFRRDCRSPPFAVHRSLALTVSSPRELRSPSESSVSCPPSVSPPPAPSMGFAVPLRDITEWRPCPRASQLSSAFPSATFLTSPTAFSALRLVGLFHPTATSRVRSSGVFPRKQPRRLSPSLLVPSRRLSADPLTMLPPPPRIVVPPSGLCSACESVADASAINRCADPIPS